MHPKIQTLLQLQTDFLIRQISGEALRQRVDEELTLLLQELGQRRLHELIDHAALLELLQKHVLGYQPGSTLRSELRNHILRLLNSPVFQEAVPEHLLHTEDIQNLVRTLLAQKELLQTVVHNSLANPVYAEVLSDLLYHSIKDYMLQENLLTKKVPGMASLMKIGKGVVEKMGNLEENFEKAIKNYIRKNIASSISLSEQLILQACEGPAIERALLDLWQQIRSTPMHRLTRHVNAENLQTIDDLLQSAWNRWRVTPLARRLAADLLQTWFESNTERTLGQLLNLLSIDIRTLVLDALPVIEPATTLLIDNGFLHQRLQARLLEFYQQDSVQHLLAGD